MGHLPGLKVSLLYQSLLKMFLSKETLPAFHLNLAVCTFLKTLPKLEIKAKESPNETTLTNQYKKNFFLYSLTSSRTELRDSNSAKSTVLPEYNMQLDQPESH